MKRETAYKIALDALEEKRKKDYVNHQGCLKHGDLFDFHVKGHKRYERITEAMEIMQNEMVHKQMELFPSWLGGRAEMSTKDVVATIILMVIFYVIGGVGGALFILAIAGGIALYRKIRE